MKNLLSRSATALGISSQAEPKDCRYVDSRDGKERWPDIRCYGVGAAIVEVAVVHPTAPSYVLVAQNPLGAAKMRQGQKQLKLSQIPEAKNTPLFCFVMETHGGFSPEALLFIRHIQQYALVFPPSIPTREVIASPHQNNFSLPPTRQCTCIGGGLRDPRSSDSPQTHPPVAPTNTF